MLLLVKYLYIYSTIVATIKIPNISTRPDLYSQAISKHPHNRNENMRVMKTFILRPDNFSTFFFRTNPKKKTSKRFRLREEIMFTPKIVNHPERRI